MAHFVVTQAPGVWITGYAVPTADWQSLDAKVFAAIDGDNGGCYAPSSPITISGAGGGGLTVSGPTIVSGAGCPAGTPGTITTTSTATVTLNDGEYQDLLAGHTGRSRTLVTSLAISEAPPPVFLALPGAYLAPFTYPTIPLSRNRTYMAAQAQAPVMTMPNAVQAELHCPLRVHNGATLSSVAITFRVSQPHTSVPATMPKVRVMRIDSKGTVAPLTLTTDLQGWVSVPTPTSGSTWYANGAAQTLTIACNQNNAIDVSQYTYLVDILEETGGTSWPLAATVMQGVKAAVLNPAYVLSGVAVLVDGYTLVAGDRVLVVQGLPTDGIYLAAAGAWTRSTDMPASAPVTAGTIVPVLRGLQYAGQVFQVLTGPLTVSAVALPFLLGGQATGNLWIAAAAAHTNITSTKFS